MCEAHIQDAPTTCRRTNVRGQHHKGGTYIMKTVIQTGDVKAQAKQAIGNLIALLNEAGSDADHVIKTTVFIKDMNDFAAVNEVYATFFEKDCPARSCVEVARLPKDVKIEIEAIAIKK